MAELRGWQRVDEVQTPFRDARRNRLYLCVNVEPKRWARSYRVGSFANLLQILLACGAHEVAIEVVELTVEAATRSAWVFQDVPPFRKYCMILRNSRQTCYY